MLFRTFAVLLFLITTSTMSQAGTPAVAEVAYPLGNASLYDFKSVKLGRDLQIMISLPGSYNESEDKQYPVIYTLDGQWHFTLAGAASGALYYDRGWPESINVGITWKGTVQDAERLRYQDFTPTTIESAPETGRGDRYLDFLQYELQPFMRQHYRVSDDQVLMGSSLGGLLALYCLFTRPELFSDYIASSPAVWWDNNVLDRYRQSFNGDELKKPVRLYISRGEMEHSMQAGADTLADELQRAGYEKLEVGFDIVKGTGHGALNPEVITRGLQFIFEKDWIDMSEETLQAYTGEFAGSDDFPDFSINAKNGKLETTDPDTGKTIRLVAVEPDRFFVPNQGAEITFERNSGEPASAMVLQAPGFKQRLLRKGMATNVND